ncbi:MAG: site-specific DNA-methyltransferase [Dehalococcoidia bacterium]|nr:site-specific DNA-methyltransferase [Dehalococcoidia bacterium]
MEIQSIEISKLRPHPQNPRTHPDSAIEKLVKSLKEYGFTNPILISADNYVLAGHARLKAAEKAGLKEVPVIQLSLSGNKALAYMIMDNRVQDETDWDFPKLKDIFGMLDTGEFNLEITGFDLSEIENLMTSEKAGLTDDDEVPEPKESICKAGDLWELGNHRLLCGNATVEAHVAKLMADEKADEKADMVFTDPPYGINVVSRDLQGIGGNGATHFSGRVGYSHIVKAKRYHPVVGDDKPFDPTFLLILAPVVAIFGGNYFASRLPDSAGWLVWDKKGQEWHDTFADGELIWTNRKKHLQIYRCIWKGMVKEGESGKRYHPTQKPIKLCADILADMTMPNQVVLDLFGGSGSTLIACEKLNRKCYMMEIDEHYCDVIIERWQNFTGRKAIKC